MLPGPSLAQAFSSARRTTRRGAGQDPQPRARAVATARRRPTRRDPRPRVPVWSRSLGGRDLGRSPPAGSRRLTPPPPSPGSGSRLHFRVSPLGRRSLGRRNPGWMRRPRHPGQPLGREEVREREEEVAREAGARRRGARRVTLARAARE